MVSGMNYSPDITMHSLQEQFKSSCIQFSVVAKDTSEIQTIQIIYKTNPYET